MCVCVRVRTVEHFREILVIRTNSVIFCCLIHFFSFEHFELLVFFALSFCLLVIT